MTDNAPDGSKRWFLRAEDIRPLAPGFGACFASDRIMVSGMRVGFMYREAPDLAGDSGWRFLSGDETQDELDDPDRIGVFDVNTVANVDPSIVPLLLSRVGSAFERGPGDDRFVAVDFVPDRDA
jgi:hypothetical protein